MQSSYRNRGVAIAWSPLNAKTVVRAGFGMYNDLQDALGYRADQNAPFNPTYTTPLTVAQLPIDPAGTISGNGEADSGRSATEYENADVNFVFAASAARALAQHFANGGLCWLARLSRDDWHRCQ